MALSRVDVHSKSFILHSSIQLLAFFDADISIAIEMHDMWDKWSRKQRGMNAIQERDYDCHFATIFFCADPAEIGPNLHLDGRGGEKLNCQPFVRTVN